MTLGAAEQWYGTYFLCDWLYIILIVMLSLSDVYKAADKHNVVVVGGAARSVGAAGGWVQGGGHSPLGGMYGMGVDSKLTQTRWRA